MAPSRPSPRRLTLLTRAYCSLCEAMQREAAAAALAQGATLEMIDVDAHPGLEATWGERVPVLFLGPPDPVHELCHHRFDRARVRSALRAAAAPDAPGPVA